MFFIVINCLIIIIKDFSFFISWISPQTFQRHFMFFSLIFFLKTTKIHLSLDKSSITPQPWMKAGWWCAKETHEPQLSTAIRQVCRHMLLAKRSTLLCLLFSFPSAGFGLHNPINHHRVAACLVQNLLPCGLDFLNSRFVSTALDYTVTACKPVWNETVIRKRCSFDSVLLQQVAKSRHLNVQQMTECVLG